MKRASLALVVLAAACGHSEPFDYGTEPFTAPRSPGAVAQLTFSVGNDQEPAFFPDGDSIIYVTERGDRSDHDRCLAIMPASGGTVRDMVCQQSPRSADSMDIFAVPTPGPDGHVAFLYSTFDLYTLTSYHTRGLLVSPLDAPFALPNRVFNYPYAAPGGFAHDGIASIRWRSPTQLVYVATLPHYPQPCKFCRPDVATPVQIVLVDLAGDTATSTVLPNSIYATSIALQGPDTLYFTVLGDSRVIRRVLSTNVETLAYDYGPNNIARDLQVHRNTLYATVGGDVSVQLLIGMGYVQNDDGGAIHKLDLVTGADQVVNTGQLRFRHTALSPDGRLMIAEARSANQDWDLWRIELP